VPPEDELADEVPLRDENDSAEGDADPPPANPSDSGVDFAVGGEAPDDDPQYADYDGPTEDLSGELADDAGQEASYGYDTAAETARFAEARAELSDLTDKAAVPDDSDQYRLSESDHGEGAVPFAEEAATTGSDDATYEPAAVADPDDSSGYSSHHPDLHSDIGAVPVEEPASADDEMGPAGRFTPVEEPAPEPVRPAAKQPSAPPKRAPAPEPVVDNSPKPGQVRKSAIDEMFARAAELKKHKGR
jgi:hypothetical protein